MNKSIVYIGRLAGGARSRNHPELPIRTGTAGSPDGKTLAFVGSARRFESTQSSVTGGRRTRLTTAKGLG